MASPEFFIGRTKPLDGAEPSSHGLPPHHLVTHGVVLGMTGSGKTGLTMVLVEEALRAKIPAILIDIKGDLPNLCFAYPEILPENFAPYIDVDGATRAGKKPEEVALDVARKLREGLDGWGLGEAALRELCDAAEISIVTPGAKIGDPLNVLSALSERSALWGVDDELAESELAAGISLLLRLAGREGDTQSKDHVVLTAFALRRINEGQAAPLEDLLRDLLAPPIAEIGVMAFEDFFPPKEQQGLAQALNALLASPRLAVWQSGRSLDIHNWMKPTPSGKTPAVIVTVAHLDDEEKTLVLGLLLDAIVNWVKGLSGTSSLRALVVIDEVFGLLPPHPANPPTKKPILTLLKQARAFGVGTLLATQNPMDVDYKALSNAGLWFVGRLLTDADRARVVEGLSTSQGGMGELDRAEATELVKNLPQRHFLVRNTHRSPSCAVVESRYALSWLRGPMTRKEISAVYQALPKVEGVSSAPTKPARSGVGAARSPDSSASRAASNGVSAATSPPTVPMGWANYFGRRDAAGPVRYVPYVAATALVRLKDTARSIALELQRSALFPIGPDGRLDVAAATLVEPEHLTAGAQGEGVFERISAPLLTKKGSQAAEKSIRDFWMSRPVSVEFHKETGLVRSANESKESFLARCQGAIAKVIEVETARINAKHAPVLAKLSIKSEAAGQALHAARVADSAAPSDLSSVLVSVAFNRRVGSSMSKARAKATAQLDKATQASAKADTAYRAAVHERDAEIVVRVEEIRRSLALCPTEQFLPKRGDVEILSVGIAWSPQAVGPA